MTLVLGQNDLVYNRGSDIEGWQRTYNHTRSQKHYAILRRSLHEQMRIAASQMTETKLCARQAVNK